MCGHGASSGRFFDGMRETCCLSCRGRGLQISRQGGSFVSDSPRGQAGRLKIRISFGRGLRASSTATLFKETNCIYIAGLANRQTSSSAKPRTSTVSVTMPVCMRDDLGLLSSAILKSAATKEGIRRSAVHACRNRSIEPSSTLVL